ncbi:class I SAM-dependent methyltransferase [Paenibacillus macerans]|uniref:class I SAM-dependent methyltransferase n=1 Tax=Paenibacillus macerans TaxID=44252 RepID=UPI003D31C4A3
MRITPGQMLSAIGLIVVLLAVLAIVYRSWRNGISPMPSSAAVRKAAIAELRRMMVIRDKATAGAEYRASPRSGAIVEAGSGWGTLALDIARALPERRVTGIENSGIPWLFSRLAAGMSGCRNLELLRGDLYAYPYETAAWVVCYLYPGAMKRLDPLFREKLASGSRVVSICFALPGWRADKVVACRDLYRTKIYVYKID